MKKILVKIAWKLMGTKAVEQILVKELTNAKERLDRINKR